MEDSPAGGAIARFARGGIFLVYACELNDWEIEGLTSSDELAPQRMTKVSDRQDNLRLSA